MHRASCMSLRRDVLPQTAAAEDAPWPSSVARPGPLHAARPPDADCELRSAPAQAFPRTGTAARPIGTRRVTEGEREGERERERMRKRQHSEPTKVIEEMVREDASRAVVHPTRRFYDSLARRQI